MTGLPHEFFVRHPGERFFRCHACRETVRNLREQMAHAGAFRRPRPIGDQR